MKETSTSAHSKTVPGLCQHGLQRPVASAALCRLALLGFLGWKARVRFLRYSVCYNFPVSVPSYPAVWAARLAVVLTCQVFFKGVDIVSSASLAMGFMGLQENFFRVVGPILLRLLLLFDQAVCLMCAT